MRIAGDAALGDRGDGEGLTAHRFDGVAPQCADHADLPPCHCFRVHSLRAVCAERDYGPNLRNHSVDAQFNIAFLGWTNGPDGRNVREFSC